MKPFDLEKAKAGKPVCTRDGNEARIVCFDVKSNKYPIIGLVNINGEEYPYAFTEKGFLNDETMENSNDLFMVGEKKEGWINAYHASTERCIGVIYSTKEEAMNRRINTFDIRYIDTIKIEWEE